MSLVRIDKVLSNRGYCSRKEVQGLVRAGLLMEGDALIKKSDQKVDPDLVTIEGEPLDPGEGLTIVLNKPCGYVCSLRDKGSLIYELLPERFGMRNPVLASVGRLDKETSGLLVLTDDGALNHKLTSPNKKVGKTYHVFVDRPFSGEEAAIFEGGDMVLKDEMDPLLPAIWKPLSLTDGYLTIFEGRYHQVRRMFDTLGTTVTALHRTHIGSLSLDGLEEGEWRMFTEEDRALILTPKG